MARSEVFLESLVNYYSTLAFSGLALCRSTKEDIRTDSFEYKKAASRMAAWWMDAYEGWWSALLVSGSPPVPTLFLAFAADSGTHAKTVSTRVPVGSNLRTTKIVNMTDGTPLKAATRIEVATLRDSLTLYVSDLTDPTPGTYQGFIHIDELALAQVVVEVLPAAPSIAKRAEKRKGAVALGKRKAAAKKGPARPRPIAKR